MIFEVTEVKGVIEVKNWDFDRSAVGCAYFSINLQLFYHQKVTSITSSNFLKFY
jgi:hypothetical protein